MELGTGRTRPQMILALPASIREENEQPVILQSPTSDIHAETALASSPESKISQRTFKSLRVVSTSLAFTNNILGLVFTL